MPTNWCHHVNKGTDVYWWWQNPIECRELCSVTDGFGSTSIKLRCNLMLCSTSLDCYHSYQPTPVPFLHHLRVPAIVTDIFSDFTYSWYAFGIVAQEKSRKIFTSFILQSNGVNSCPHTKTDTATTLLYLSYISSGYDYFLVGQNYPK